MNNARPINPGIAHILEVRKLKEQIVEKDAIIARQDAEIKTLLESGIHLRGWICKAVNREGRHCETFNGQEKDTLEECRFCGHRNPNFHG